jgi:hypothetical protein
MPVLPIHQAADMSFDPSACVVLTAANLQAALLEVDTELAAIPSSYQPLDADLTAIAALTGTNTLYYRQAANTWAAVTIGGGLSFSGGTLQTSGVLLTANNLSELTATAATARSNLGLGTMAVEAASTYLTVAAAAAGYQPLDGDLSAIAALTGTNTLYYRSAINTWSAVTIGTGLSFSAGTLSFTGGGITSLGGQTGATQTFLTSTTGTDFTISSSANVHTFAIPDASATSRGLVTTGAQTFAGQKTFAQGTLTSSAPLTLTQTWNSGATTFTGALVNITDTASASASLLQDWQVGGSSKVTLRKDGQMSFWGTGSGLGLAQLQGGGGSSWFIYSGGTFQSPLFNCNGWFGMVDGAAGGVQFFSGHGIVWSGTGASGLLTRNSLTGDIGLFRGGAGIIEQRYSTTAQSYLLYNTYSSSTNNESFKTSWVSNEARMGTAVGSAGGTRRNVVLGSWSSAGTWSPAITVNGTSQATTINGTLTCNNAVTFGGNLYVGGHIDLPYGLSKLRCFEDTTTNIALAPDSVIIAANSRTVIDLTSSYCNFTPQGAVTVAPAASTSGSKTDFVVTAPAHTAQTASTESPSVNFNLSATKQFATGSITTQRAFRIQAPTYAFASASTITNAATLSISGAPVAGTNATLTNSYALWVEAGMSQFGGIINTTAALVLNTGSQSFNTSYHFVNWNGACVGWSSAGTVNSTSTLDTAMKRVSAGLVEINNGTAGTYRDLVLRNLRMSTPTVPASASDSGSEGQISWDGSNIYVCTATNTWKRVAIATF